MAILPLQLARVSNLLRSGVATQSMARTQQELLEVQNQLSTGKRVNSPSDDPSSAAIIQQLQKTLSTRQGWSANINAAKSQLGAVDATLGDVNELLKQAQQIASQNVSSIVSADERKSAAAVVDSIYNQMFTVANKQFGDSYLFGADLATEPPFGQASGGVQFIGSSKTLSNTVDLSTQLGFQVGGDEVFGGRSARVSGSVDLSPQIVSSTRISKLRGALGDGVHLGSIRVSDGTTNAIVDLTGADSIGDITAAINGAGLTGVTASLGQFALTLTASGGANISIDEVGGGSTAADLGILMPVGAGANLPLNGASVGAKVTEFTLMSTISGGAGIDPTGFTISNGGQSKVISVNAGMSVEDLLNQINSAGLGVHAQINAAGDGIDVLNAVQGASMSISENGGTTATNLGIRSFSSATLLADLNDGKGVATVTGGDFSITTADGTITNVDLNAPLTMQDVINQINTAAAGKVTASFAGTGNGLVLTDNTVGVTPLSITPLNFSKAAADLGLMAAPASGNTITGADANQIVTPGIFSDLQKLRDALRGNSTSGITTAAEGLTVDAANVIQLRGTTGARVQELESRSERIDDENVATKALLSQLQDADMTETITQFQTLQNSLQATLQTTAQTLNLSLLDYLG